MTVLALLVHSYSVRVMYVRVIFSQIQLQGLWSGVECRVEMGSCGGAGEGLAAEVLTRAFAQIAKLDGHPPRPFPPVGTGGWAPGERVGLQALRARLTGCTGEIRPQVPDALTGDMLVRTCTCSHLYLSSHTCPGMFSQHPGTDTHFLTCMCMFLQ